MSRNISCSVEKIRKQHRKYTKQQVMLRPQQTNPSRMIKRWESSCTATTLAILTTIRFAYLLHGNVISRYFANSNQFKAQLSSEFKTNTIETERTQAKHNMYQISNQAYNLPGSMKSITYASMQKSIKDPSDSIIVQLLII